MKSPHYFLHEPSRQEGASIPLFERLCDFEQDEPAEAPIKKFYTKENFIISIEDELNRILGTHVKFRRNDYLDMVKDPTYYRLPGMYGIWDFEHFDATNTENWKIWERHIATVVDFFEPRVTRSRVKILGFNKNTQQLQMDITTTLRDAHFNEEVTFSMAIS